MAKTIGMVGSRRRNTKRDFNLCLVALRKIFKEGDSLVSGGCPLGADNFAETISKTYSIPIIIHYPDWTKGRFAGLERNGLISNDADILIACVSKDRKGGTEDTIRKFLKTGNHNLIIV